MKRMKAFLTALVLFVATVLGCHFYIHHYRAKDCVFIPTAPSEEKGKLRTVLTEQMPEDGYPVFGSSEFQHGADTAYHPAHVFEQTDFHPMLIGAGYYQSLSHAVTLASIEESVKVRKAALILSPQWFRKTGVVDQAYASRFSETHYAAAIGNEALSAETKQYISDRTRKLLEVDEKTRARVLRYDEVYWKHEGDSFTEFRTDAWSSFLHEKELFETMLLEKSLERNCNSENALAAPLIRETSEAAPAAPDWDALYELAEQEGREQNQNPFFIDDTAYDRIEPHLPEKKGISSDADRGYQTGPEFDDLRCFLTVCQELGIEPMILVVPVNGYYYDHTGFPKEARAAYYAKVKGIAKEYGARIADFSDQEYTKYFFEDRVHLGKKGWLMVNESLYEFYKEA